MMSLWLYTGFLALTALERLVEVRLSKRNAAWSLARGGVEHGQGHFPVMVALHTAFLVACLAEPWLLDRPFVPVLGWTMVALAVASQVGRWWCIQTLGPRWNTRVLIVPDLPPVASGPYRFLKHPNYIAVVIEIIVLPLIHGAWLTAAVFSVLNAALLSVRIRTENRALATLPR